MTKRYEPEFKQEIICLYLEEGWTMKSLTEEYNLGSSILRYWLKVERKECKDTKLINTEYVARLRKQVMEVKKKMIS